MGIFEEIMAGVTPPESSIEKLDPNSVSEITSGETGALEGFIRGTEEMIPFLDRAKQSVNPYYNAEQVGAHENMTGFGQLGNFAGSAATSIVPIGAMQKAGSGGIRAIEYLIDNAGKYKGIREGLKTLKATPDYAGKFSGGSAIPTFMADQAAGAGSGMLYDYALQKSNDKEYNLGESAFMNIGAGLIAGGLHTGAKSAAKAKLRRTIDKYTSENDNIVKLSEQGKEALKKSLKNEKNSNIFHFTENSDVYMDLSNPAAAEIADTIKYKSYKGRSMIDAKGNDKSAIEALKKKRNQRGSNTKGSTYDGGKEQYSYNDYQFENDKSATSGEPITDYMSDKTEDIQLPNDFEFSDEHAATLGKVFGEGDKVSSVYDIKKAVYDAYGAKNIDGFTDADYVKAYIDLKKSERYNPEPSDEEFNPYVESSPETDPEAFYRDFEKKVQEAKSRMFEQQDNGIPIANKTDGMAEAKWKKKEKQFLTSRERVAAGRQNAPSEPKPEMLKVVKWEKNSGKIENVNDRFNSLLARMKTAKTPEERAKIQNEFADLVGSRPEDNTDILSEPADRSSWVPAGQEKDIMREPESSKHVSAVKNALMKSMASNDANSFELLARNHIENEKNLSAADKEAARNEIDSFFKQWSDVKQMLEAEDAAKGTMTAGKRLFKLMKEEAKKRVKELPSAVNPKEKMNWEPGRWTEEAKSIGERVKSGEITAKEGEGLLDDLVAEYEHVKDSDTEGYPFNEMIGNDVKADETIDKMVASYFKAANNKKRSVLKEYLAKRNENALGKNEFIRDSLKRDIDALEKAVGEDGKPVHKKLLASKKKRLSGVERKIESLKEKIKNNSDIKKTFSAKTPKPKEPGSANRESDLASPGTKQSAKTTVIIKTGYGIRQGNTDIPPETELKVEEASGSQSYFDKDNNTIYIAKSKSGKKEAKQVFDAVHEQIHQLIKTSARFENVPEMMFELEQLSLDDPALAAILNDAKKAVSKSGVEVTSAEGHEEIIAHIMGKHIVERIRQNMSPDELSSLGIKFSGKPNEKYLYLPEAVLNNQSWKDIAKHIDYLINNNHSGLSMYIKGLDPDKALYGPEPNAFFKTVGQKIHDSNKHVTALLDGTSQFLSEQTWTSWMSVNSEHAFMMRLAGYINGQHKEMERKLAAIHNELEKSIKKDFGERGDETLAYLKDNGFMDVYAARKAAGKSVKFEDIMEEIKKREFYSKTELEDNIKAAVFQAIEDAIEGPDIPNVMKAVSETLSAKKVKFKKIVRTKGGGISNGKTYKKWSEKWVKSMARDLYSALYTGKGGYVYSKKARSWKSGKKWSVVKGGSVRNEMDAAAIIVKKLAKRMNESREEPLLSDAAQQMLQERIATIMRTHVMKARVGKAASRKSFSGNYDNMRKVFNSKEFGKYVDIYRGQVKQLAQTGSLNSMTGSNGAPRYMRDGYTLQHGRFIPKNGIDTGLKVGGLKLFYAPSKMETLGARESVLGTPHVTNVEKGIDTVTVGFKVDSNGRMYQQYKSKKVYLTEREKRLIHKIKRGRDTSKVTFRVPDDVKVNLSRRGGSKEDMFSFKFSEQFSRNSYLIHQTQFKKGVYLDAIRKAVNAGILVEPGSVDYIKDFKPSAYEYITLNDGKGYYAKKQWLKQFTGSKGVKLKNAYAVHTARVMKGVVDLVRNNLIVGSVSAYINSYIASVMTHNIVRTGENPVDSYREIKRAGKLIEEYQKLIDDYGKSLVADKRSGSKSKRTAELKKKIDDHIVGKAYNLGIQSTIRDAASSLNLMPRNQLIAYLAHFGASKHTLEALDTLHMRPGSKLGDKLGTIFDKTEVISKLATFLNKVENGMSHEKAAEFVNMAYPNYSLNLTGIGAFVDDFIPFMKYFASVPHMMYTAFSESPGKLAAMKGVQMGLVAGTASAFGSEDTEWYAEKGFVHLTPNVLWYGRSASNYSFDAPEALGTNALMRAVVPWDIMPVTIVD